MVRLRRPRPDLDQVMPFVPPGRHARVCAKFWVPGIYGLPLPASLSPLAGRGWPTGRERGCRSRHAFPRHDLSSAAIRRENRTRCIVGSDDSLAPAFPSPAFGTLSPQAGRGTQIGVSNTEIRIPKNFQARRWGDFSANATGARSHDATGPGTGWNSGWHPGVPRSRQRMRSAGLRTSSLRSRCFHS